MIQQEEGRARTGAKGTYQARPVLCYQENNIPSRTFTRGLELLGQKQLWETRDNDGVWGNWQESLGESLNWAVTPKKPTPVREELIRMIF